MTSSFFKDADGAIIVFDLINYESFLNVKDWINSFYKMKGKDLPMTVVGNKLDLCSPVPDQNEDPNAAQE